MPSSMKMPQRKMLTASTWFKHTGINMHLNNTIIPSVRKYKHFEQALSCSSEYVLLSEANIGNLQSLIGKCHQSGKKVLIHLELLGGFKPDQAGISLLKNYYKVDGVISSNLSALRHAKKRDC